jgi:hypothetical protein
MAELELPKLAVRVRFPSPAPLLRPIMLPVASAGGSAAAHPWTAQVNYGRFPPM